jgi:hypothetical protein
MEKKLPNVFVNRINKQINNCQTFYYSKNDKKEAIKVDTNSNDDRIINKKINYFINLPKNLYNFDLVIKTKDKDYETKIVARDDNNIITTDNEIIAISDIVTIEIKK